MDEPTTAGMAPARRQQFEADIAKVRVKTGASANESRLVALGVALMSAGVIVAVVAFAISGTQADTRDVISSLILAVAGVAVSVVGAAIFLRHSFARFLRFWLLRLMYEQQAPTDGPT